MCGGLALVPFSEAAVVQRDKLVICINITFRFAAVSF